MTEKAEMPDRIIAYDSGDNSYYSRGWLTPDEKPNPAAGPCPEDIYLRAEPVLSVLKTARDYLYRQRHNGERTGFFTCVDIITAIDDILKGTEK